MREEIEKLEDVRDLVFFRICLIEWMEKQRDGKLICSLDFTQDANHFSSEWLSCHWDWGGQVQVETK